MNIIMTASGTSSLRQVLVSGNRLTFFCVLFLFLFLQDVQAGQSPGNTNKLAEYWALLDQGSVTNQLTWERVSSSENGKFQTAVVKAYGSVTGGNLYLSRDFGRSWAPSTNHFNLGWSGVAVSRSGKYQTAVAEGNYIYVSKDYGQSWKAIAEAQGNWTSVAMSADGRYQTAVANSYNNTNYFSTGICCSSDYGKTWTPLSFSYNSWLSVNLSGSGRIQTAVSFVIEGTEDPDGRQGCLYNSYDYGNTWELNTNLPPNYYTSSGMSGNGRIQVVGLSNCNLAPATPGPIFISCDYGKTFSESSAPVDNWLNFSLSQSGRYLLAAAYQQTDTNEAIVPGTGGLYASSDFGVTWFRTDAPWNTWTSVQLAANGAVATATAWGSGIFIKHKSSAHIPVD